MKYGRRDVRCSGAVELVVLREGERKWGGHVVGGSGSYQSSPVGTPTHKSRSPNARV